jgi:hypothetical protein
MKNTNTGKNIAEAGLPHLNGCRQLTRDRAMKLINLPASACSKSRILTDFPRETKESF